MKVFNLPDLGEGLTEAEIHEWHVKVGDTVKTDQLMVSMETAKAVVDVPAPFPGRITKLYGESGDIIETGAPLIEFEGREAEANNSPTAEDAATVVGNIQTSDSLLEEKPTGITPKPTTASNRVKAVPAVRALAKKRGVDINAITPTGPNGQMTAQDVENASTAATKAPEALGQPMKKIQGMRRTMAHVMAHSNTNVCPVALTDDADIEHWPKGEDLTVRLISAVVAAAQIEPALNAHYHHASCSRALLNSVNIAVAVDTPEGLMAPVIQEAQKLSKEALRDVINQFKTHATERTFPPEVFRDATITLSNFGIFAGRYANPIVVEPTVAILGVGRFRNTVVPVEGGFESHRILPLSLTFDHRAVTGGEASRFLKAIIDSLQAD